MVLPEDRNSTFNVICEIPADTGTLLLEKGGDIFSVLIGRHAENHTIEEMEKYG